MLIFVLIALAGISFFLTSLLRRYALARNIIDVPNARSSHSIPTPRGGGIAIVVAFLIAVPALADLDAIDFQSMWALLGGGAVIALLGFLDDHGHIAARWRLVGHFLAAIWALFWLGGAPPLSFLGFTVNLSLGGSVLAVVCLVWLLNLFNFMDGIDGIASVEAICVCVGGALLYAVLGLSGAAVLPLVLAATVLGFLLWNFPPAKIFMGDAGSGFLGIVLGVFSLQAAWAAPQLLWCWLILLGVFIVDATWTLFRRLLRRERVYQAHRSHAYQYASRRLGSHRAVTLSVLLINVAWLFPIALLVALHYLDGLLGLLLAYFPLVLLAIRFDAGKPEVRESAAQ